MLVGPEGTTYRDRGSGRLDRPGPWVCDVGTTKNRKPMLLATQAFLRNSRKQGDTPGTPAFCSITTLPLRHPATASPVAVPLTLPPCLRLLALLYFSFAASGKTPDGLRARRKPRLFERNVGTDELRCAVRQIAAS